MIHLASSFTLRKKDLSYLALIITCVAPLSAQVGESVKHWAYKKPEAISPPKVTDANWSANPIDAFIYDNLVKQNLTPNPEADRLTLVRRAYYDLTGLPPTQEQVEKFLLDDSPQAYEHLIDQLLDSPHYGEKWGRHWLDVARWADSNGYERDSDKRNMWKYRDYVINAINKDKPYDEFVIDQIAGDVIPNPTPESITATGFLRLGLYDDEPADEELFYYDYYDDIINTVSRSMLATSMSCARCHDHKVDPISQKEYYQFLAFFRNLYVPYRMRNHDDITVSIFNPETEAELKAKIDKGIDDITIPRFEMWRALNGLLNYEIPAVELADYPYDLNYQFAIEDWEDGHPALEDANFLISGALTPGPIQLASDLSEIKGANKTAAAHSITGKVNLQQGGTQSFRVKINGGGSMYLGNQLVFSKVGPNEITQEFSVDLPAGTHELKIVASRRINPVLEVTWLRDSEPVQWVSQTNWRSLKKETADLLKSDSGSSANWKKLYDKSLELEKQALEAFEPLEQQLRESLVTAAANDVEEKPTYILFRGNPHSPGEEVQPDVTGVLDFPLKTSASEDRRLALAKWIASPDNPSTARVAVNRIWQHHFGRGLVPSSDEFGGLGDEPTHPRLLDWLANEFVRNGWHMKPLHRLIMTSATYKMSSAPNDKALAKDPLNDAFWRFNMRRLTAEEIRDSILVTADHFNSQVGGPSVFPKMPEEVLQTASRAEERWNLEAGPEHQNRRSVYTFTRRSLLDPMLSSFDAADTDTSCPVRFNTTVPAQALTMMNSDFVSEHAQMLTDRLVNAVSLKDTDHLIRTGFEMVLGRLPEDSEIDLCQDLIESMQQEFGHDRKTAIERFALMMLNLNEFIYLD